MKRAPLSVGIAAVFALALAVGPASPSMAATSTWFNGSAKHATKYSESTAYNSRTGTTASFPSQSYAGQARIRVWSGTNYTDCWDFSCTIKSARNYALGAFRWDMPGALSSDKTGMKGWAVNVGPLARSASPEMRDPEELAPETPSFTEIPKDALSAGTIDGFEFFSGTRDGWSYFSILTDEGVLSSAFWDGARDPHHLAPMGVGDETTGESRYFYLLPSEAIDSGLAEHASVVASSNRVIEVDASLVGSVEAQFQLNNQLEALADR